MCVRAHNIYNYIIIVLKGSLGSYKYILAFNSAAFHRADVKKEEKNLLHKTRATMKTSIKIYLNTNHFN